MTAIPAFDPLTFVTVLLLTFALFLIITGAFTAYFGSGKSRKIGAALLVGGLVVGILWGFVTSKYSGAVALGVTLSGTTSLSWVILEAVGVILAAVVGAAAAIGLFLLAIMKS